MKKTVTLVSWNVNGFRSVLNKGFSKWAEHLHPDVLCLQETKMSPDQLSSKMADSIPYEHRYWASSSVKKGYSGVATFCAQEPVCAEIGLGSDRYDGEGRVVMTEFPEFVLFNVYFPNGKASMDRLHFKLEFYEDFLRLIDRLKKKGKKIIFCGDVNTAHREIDLARPKANETISGFLPIEREWIDRVLDHGFVDSLRAFHPEPDLYTWWDLKSGARSRNVGWRIDYFFVQKELLPHLKDAFLLPEVQGSDHCPVGIHLEFSGH